MKSILDMLLALITVVATASLAGQAGQSMPPSFTVAPGEGVRLARGCHPRWAAVDTSMGFSQLEGLEMATAAAMSIPGCCCLLG